MRLAIIFLLACVTGSGVSGCAAPAGTQADAPSAAPAAPAPVSYDGLLTRPPPRETNLTGDQAWALAAAAQLRRSVFFAQHQNQPQPHDDNAMVQGGREIEAAFSKQPGYLSNQETGRLAVFAIEHGSIDARAHADQVFDVFSGDFIPPFPKIRPDGSMANGNTWQNMLHRTVIHWLKTAADSGSLLAQKKLGLTYLTLPVGGTFLSSQIQCPVTGSCIDQGLYYARLAAQRGDAETQSALGAYLTGNDVGNGLIRPTEAENAALRAEGEHWLREAARQGDKDATILVSAIDRKAAEARARAAHDRQEQAENEAAAAAERKREAAAYAAMSPAERHAQQVQQCRKGCAFRCGMTNFYIGGGMAGLMWVQNSRKLCENRCYQGCGS